MRPGLAGTQAPIPSCHGQALPTPDVQLTSCSSTACTTAGPELLVGRSARCSWRHHKPLLVLLVVLLASLGSSCAVEEEEAKATVLPGLEEPKYPERPPDYWVIGQVRVVVPGQGKGQQSEATGLLPNGIPLRQGEELSWYLGVPGSR